MSKSSASKAVSLSPRRSCGARGSRHSRIRSRAIGPPRARARKGGGAVRGLLIRALADSRDPVDRADQRLLIARQQIVPPQLARLARGTEAQGRLQYRALGHELDRALALLGLDFEQIGAAQRADAEHRLPAVLGKWELDDLG